MNKELGWDEIVRREPCFDSEEVADMWEDSELDLEGFLNYLYELEAKALLKDEEGEE